jgi:hypothetical protein
MFMYNLDFFSPRYHDRLSNVIFSLFGNLVTLTVGEVSENRSHRMYTRFWKIFPYFWTVLPKSFRNYEDTNFEKLNKRTNVICKILIRISYGRTQYWL